jgi:hypothetical protein
MAPFFATVTLGCCAKREGSRLLRLGELVIACTGSEMLRDGQGEYYRMPRTFYFCLHPACSHKYTSVRANDPDRSSLFLTPPQAYTGVSLTVNLATRMYEVNKKENPVENALCSHLHVKK